MVPLLDHVLASPDAGTRPRPDAVRGASRLKRTAELAEHLERVTTVAAVGGAAVIG
jgi:hypothetical protein